MKTILLTAAIFAAPAFSQSESVTGVVGEADATPAAGNQQEWDADYSSASDIFEYIEQMQSLHPNASLEEMDAFVKQDFGRGQRLAEADDGSDLDYSGVVDELLPPGAQMNDAEKALFNGSPWKGLMVINAGRLARDSAKDLYIEGLWNGNGDAYRHCYWNNLMVMKTDQEFAKAWGDAHESNPNNPQFEKVMDISNNNDGRRLAANHRNDSDKERSSRCLDGVVTKRLVRIVNNKIVPTDGTGRR